MEVGAGRSGGCLPAQRVSHKPQERGTLFHASVALLTILSPGIISPSPTSVFPECSLLSSVPDFLPADPFRQNRPFPPLATQSPSFSYVPSMPGSLQSLGRVSGGQWTDGLLALPPHPLPVPSLSGTFSTLQLANPHFSIQAETPVPAQGN